MSNETIVIAALLLINTVTTVSLVLVAERFYRRANELLERIQPDDTLEVSDDPVPTRVRVARARSFADRV